MTEDRRDEPRAEQKDYADELASIEELPPEEAFPRMVFRKGTTTKLNDGLEVDFLIVGNMTALRSALDHGWRLDPAHTDIDTGPKRGSKEGGDTSGLDAGEEPFNPRPNEPDNAPFQNTPYVDSQSGDAQFASPPDPPIMEPIPPEDELSKPDGQPPLGGSRASPEKDESDDNGKRGPGRPRSR